MNEYNVDNVTQIRNLPRSLAGTATKSGSAVDSQANQSLLVVLQSSVLIIAIIIIHTVANPSH